MAAGLILFFGSFYGSLLPLLVAARSDRYRTGAFDVGLPVTRHQLVTARYLLPLLLLPGWVALTYGAAWAFAGGRLPPDALHVETLLLSPVALVVMVGIFFPVVMRAGFMGLLYAGIGLQLIGVALAFVARRSAGIRGLFDAVARIGPAVRGLHARMGDPWFVLVAAAALAAAYLLSFLAADALLRRRDL